jgi:hypothetical protein
MATCEAAETLAILLALATRIALSMVFLVISQTPVLAFIQANFVKKMFFKTIVTGLTVLAPVNATEEYICIAPITMVVVIIVSLLVDPM